MFSKAPRKIFFIAKKAKQIELGKLPPDLGDLGVLAVNSSVVFHFLPAGTGLKSVRFSDPWNFYDNRAFSAGEQALHPADHRGRPRRRA
jgi:hypothetical protein